MYRADNTNNEHFQLEHCHAILANHPRWVDRLQRANNPTPVRTTTTSRQDRAPSAVGSPNDPSADSAADAAATPSVGTSPSLPRPSEGHKKAKGTESLARKIDELFPVLVAVLEQQKNIAEKQDRSKRMQDIHDLKLISMDAATITDVRKRRYIEMMQEEVYKRHEEQQVAGPSSVVVEAALSPSSVEDNDVGDISGGEEENVDDSDVADFL